MTEIAGIVTEKWKLSIFKKHLDKAGLKYVEHPGPTKGTVLLQVECESAIGIKPIIEAAHKETQRARRLH